MRFISSILPALAIVMIVSSYGAAQTVPFVDQSSSQAVELDAQQAAELDQWIKDFNEWKLWWAQWANTREPGWMTSSRQRRQKPEPPEWLADRCATVFAESDSLRPACVQLEEWQSDNVTMIKKAKQAAVIQRGEAREKKAWWEHVHLDLLWPATELRNSVYGVVGFHTAVEVKGRLQLFLTPGVMLLNLPTVDSKRTWKMATNYGIGYRLVDFRFPGGRPATLHVNIAKSWMLSDAQDALVGKNLDFVGFSIAFKR
jgi:hypothetical protein